MSNLKKILSEYEGEFNPNGWAQLEKRLPKQTFMQRFGKFIVGGAAGALVVAGVLVAVLWINDEKPSTDDSIAKTEIANAVLESTGDESAVSVSDQTSMPNAEISEPKQTATATEVAKAQSSGNTESKVDAEPAKQSEPADNNEKQEVASNSHDNQTPFSTKAKSLHDVFGSEGLSELCFSHPINVIIPIAATRSDIIIVLFITQ